MPWDDEFETFSMYLHEQVPATGDYAFFEVGETSAQEIRAALAPHLGGPDFDVVEELVPTGVGYVLKSREWLQTNVDRKSLEAPRKKAAKFVSVYIEWLRRRADELESTHAELLAEFRKPD